MDKSSLLVHSMPKSPVSEAYRVLRTNIQFSGIDKPLKTIVVTSSGPAEGKSTTISNLAITFTQSGSRVLLIDADLRKPRIHKLFGYDNVAGLTNVLVLHQSYGILLKKNAVDGLDILTSGPIPPNPSELLSSNSMKQFVKEVSLDYDIVFIDAPPIGSVTDAAILSTLVDGTIIVAASGQVYMESLKRSKQLLERVKANVIGVVLTKVDVKGDDRYYGAYYYYSEDEKGNERRVHRRRLERKKRRTKSRTVR